MLVSPWVAAQLVVSREKLSSVYSVNYRSYNDWVKEDDMYQALGDHKCI
jgi:hypothetical protein